jgi:hypothetical protein
LKSKRVVASCLQVNPAQLNLRTGCDGSRTEQRGDARYEQRTAVFDTSPSGIWSKSFPTLAHSQPSRCRDFDRLQFTQRLQQTEADCRTTERKNRMMWRRSSMTASRQRDTDIGGTLLFSHCVCRQKIRFRRKFLVRSAVDVLRFFPRPRKHADTGRVNDRRERTAATRNRRRNYSDSHDACEANDLPKKCAQTSQNLSPAFIFT